LDYCRGSTALIVKSSKRVRCLRLLLRMS
jgi:hypothetical protein